MEQQLKCKQATSQMHMLVDTNNHSIIDIHLEKTVKTCWCVIHSVIVTAELPVLVEQGVTLTRRNCTGLSCNVGHPTTHAPGPPDGSEHYK